MTAGETVTVEGDETLRRTLHAAEAEIRDLDQSENARLVQQRAQANAPKVSGRLAGSVRSRDLGRGKAVVESDLIYAPVINYGWAAHDIAPNPFMTEAAADSATVVEANSQREVQRILGKVKGA